jgi:phosphate transport system substrate-binding protein
MLLSVAAATLAIADAHADEGLKRVTPVAASERSSFERSRKVAILVGVGKYPERSGIGSLQYPLRDAQLVGQELEKQGYTVIPLTDGEATREAVRGVLRDTAEFLQNKDGTVVFYFSGHGWAVDGRNILATYDAGSANLSGSGLPLDEVVRMLAATGARRRVLWIDACRDQPGRTISTRTFATLANSEGTRILFSTKAGKVSYENSELQQGVFSHFLVRGLKGEAAGQDGLVTFRDLADFVTTNVQLYGLKRGQLQIPYEAGEASGDFLIAKSELPVKPVTEVSQPFQPFVPPDVPKPVPEIKPSPTAAVESLSAPLIRKWIEEFRQAGHPEITFQDSGSGTGHLSFSGEEFGVTDVTPDKVGSGVLQLPTAVVSVVPITNIPGITGKLNFKGQTLARIYLGQVTKWNDPEIVASNPGVKLPNTSIVVIHRVDAGATTYLLTSFFSKVSSEWKQKVGAAASVAWPVGLGARGPQILTRLVKQTPNSIGYVDFRYATLEHLTFDKVENFSGRFVDASVDSMSAAAVADFGPGLANYAISSYTYLVVSETQASKPQVREFLSWILDHQADNRSLLYAPLPVQMVNTLKVNMRARSKK